MKNENRRWTKSRSRAAISRRVGLWPFLALPLLSFCVAAPEWAQSSPQANARQPLGSLTTSGSVDVNGAAAKAQLTVFIGDSITTHENGNAKLTLASGGALVVAPLSQVVFTDSQRYLAAVNKGAITINAPDGRSNFAVRTGDYIVTAAPGAPPQTAASIERESDGSGLVSCSTGSVQVLAIEGDTSLVLNAGQATSLAFGDKTVEARAPTEPAVEAPPPKPSGRHWLRFIIIAPAAAATG
jgi:ferric-dicitrate binding protein FerR (iron transport regulator)